LAFRPNSFNSREWEISTGKEVKKMTYAKPQIVHAGSATESIQGTKPIGAFADVNPTKHQTLAAYEADE
jgi:hypothetical protein